MAEYAVIADVVVLRELLQCLHAADVVVSGEKMDRHVKLRVCVLESLDFVVISIGCQ